MVGDRLRTFPGWCLSLLQGDSLYSVHWGEGSLPQWVSHFRFRLVYMMSSSYLVAVLHLKLQVPFCTFVVGLPFCTLQAPFCTLYDFEVAILHMRLQVPFCTYMC